MFKSYLNNLQATSVIKLSKVAVLGKWDDLLYQ